MNEDCALLVMMDILSCVSMSGMHSVLRVCSAPLLNLLVVNLVTDALFFSEKKK
jgi:hypothetical protein